MEAKTVHSQTEPWSRRDFLATVSGLGLAGIMTGAVGAPDEGGPPESSIDLLCHELRRCPRVTVVSPDSVDLSSPLVTVSLPAGAPGAQLAQALREKHGVVVRAVSHGSLNGIRISTHLYNTAGDVQRLAQALADELGGNG